MAKQINRNKWISLFKKYEQSTLKWSEYYALCSSRGSYKFEKQAKRWFRNKYKQWKLLDNLFMAKKIIETRGRKPTKREKERFEEYLKDAPVDELKEIARRYHEITRKKKKNQEMQEYSKINISCHSIQKAFNLSRQTISKWKKGFKPKTIRKSYVNEYYNIIKDEFAISHQNYGRIRLSEVIKRKYKIIIPYKTLGYHMKLLNLNTNVRIAKRKREIKVISANYDDLVQRNYNQENVLATDVKYIRNTNSKFNHYYLSIAINHKTKFIESYILSKSNDLELVKQTYKGINKNNIIIHSDHGWQYSHPEIAQIANNKELKISMGIIANSLDNREAEYFFSILESELIKKQPLIKNMKFSGLQKIIKKFIYWYNYERIQSILKWKTPAEARVTC